MVVMSSLRLTPRRLSSSCSIGFWSLGVYGGQADPLTTVISPPRPGVSVTDLNGSWGKVSQASSMPGPVLGISGLGPCVLATYVGKRLATLAAGCAAPLVAGAGA